MKQSSEIQTTYNTWSGSGFAAQLERIPGISRVPVMLRTSAIDFKKSLTMLLTGHFLTCSNMIWHTFTCWCETHGNGMEWQKNGLFRIEYMEEAEQRWRDKVSKAADDFENLWDISCCSLILIWKPLPVSDWERPPPPGNFALWYDLVDLVFLHFFCPWWIEAEINAAAVQNGDDFRSWSDRALSAQIEKVVWLLRC